MTIAMSAETGRFANYLDSRIAVVYNSLEFAARFFIPLSRLGHHAKVLERRLSACASGWFPRPAFRMRRYQLESACSCWHRVGHRCDDPGFIRPSDRLRVGIGQPELISHPGGYRVCSLRRSGVPRRRRNNSSRCGECTRGSMGAQGARGWRFATSSSSRDERNDIDDGDCEGRAGSVFAARDLSGCHVALLGRSRCGDRPSCKTASAPGRSSSGKGTGGYGNQR